MASSLLVNSSHTAHLCSEIYVEILTVTLLYPVILGSLPYLGPAYDMALQEIHTLYPHLHVKQTLLADKAYRDCDTLTANTVNLITQHIMSRSTDGPRNPCTVTAFIYPGCTNSDITEILHIANELDMLMMTSAGGSLLVRDKNISPTWIATTCISYTTYINVFLNMAKTLHWRSFGILADKGANPFFADFAQRLISAFSDEHAYQVYAEIFNSKEGVDYRQVLRRLNSVARIFLYFGDPLDEFRKILLTATDLNFTDGEHVYVVMTPYRFNRKPGYLTWEKGESDDEVVRIAYRSVLIVEPDNAVYGNTKGSQQFSVDLRNRSRSDYNFTYGEYDLVSPHPASIYAAFLSFAEVLEELRKANEDYVWRAGKAFATRFLNRLFTTNYSKIYVDPVGERLPSININQLDWNTGLVRTIFVQNVSTLKLQAVEQPQWPGHWPPRNQPECGFRGDAPACEFKNHSFAIITGSSTAIVMLLIVFLSAGAAVILKRRAQDTEFLAHSIWKIAADELVPADNKSLQVQLYLKDHRLVWINQMGPVHITPDPLEKFQPLSSTVLRNLKDVFYMHNRNVNRLIGMSMIDNVWYFVTDHCSHGSICDLISEMVLDFDLQVAFIFDTLRGVQAIHRSSLKYHGHLTSSCCLIDRQFTLKIGQVGCYQTKRLLTKEHNKRRNNNEDLDPVKDSTDDISAIAVILYQIMTLEESPRLPEDVYQLIPKLSDIVSTKIIHVLPALLSCTDPVSGNRPDIHQLTRSFTHALRSHASIGKDVLLDNMLHRLETYVEELNNRVAIRTQSLLDERKKSDILLMEMLPGSVVEQLRRGLPVDAESFEMATLMFTEIGGFASILHDATPGTAMLFLNDVYSVFDTFLRLYDVYKVETIKDSYLVASGVPKRNGFYHVKEICDLSVSLFRAYSAFEPLFGGTALRAGVHSGPCVAGVIGHKAPRYCLFGDTINTASRMLLHGADGRAHLSENAVKLIGMFPGIRLEERGEIQIKGKGLMRTYWLLFDL